MAIEILIGPNGAGIFSLGSQAVYRAEALAEADLLKKIGRRPHEIKKWSMANERWPMANLVKTIIN